MHAHSWRGRAGVCQQLTLFKGVILRDTKGIGQSKSLTGSKILRVLKAKGKRVYAGGLSQLTLVCSRPRP